MRTSGPRRRLSRQRRTVLSDSATVLPRHVRQRAGVVGRARGRRRARLTARHGRGVRALPVRALPGGGRVQRGAAAGAAQPAAARAAPGPVFGVAAAGAPVCRGGARAPAALRASGGARAGGALCAAAAGAGASAAAGVLRPGVPATATVAQVLRPAVSRRAGGLAATHALRGLRGRGGRAAPGLHAAAAAAACAAAALRTPGASLLRTGSQATATLA